MRIAKPSSGPVIRNLSVHLKSGCCLHTSQYGWARKFRIGS